MSQKKKKRTKPRVYHPMDVALGLRLREVREAKGISQVWVGRESRISFQQLQKYESGQNRVSFSRLTEIAASLDIPVIDLIRPVVDSGPAT